MKAESSKSDYPEGSTASDPETPNAEDPRPGVEPAKQPLHAVFDRAASADSDGAIESRILRLERQNRWMKFALVLALVLVGFVFIDKLPPDAIVKQTLMESKELKLIDQAGNARLFLRMYSRVPVLQLMDSNGKPRMSLGLRFDDTPFLDLSDKRGRTRVSLEISADDEPKLELFDADGETKLKIR